MIKKLAAHIGQYRKKMYWVPVFVFLDSLCELTIPLLMASIIDVGVKNRDIGYITQTGGIMVLLALAAVGFGILNMRFTTDISTGVGANLRLTLFEKIQTFSFENIDKFSTSSLITRLTNDINNVQMTFMMGMRLLLRAPFMLLISFFMAYNINARLSIVIAVAIPLLAGGIMLILSQAVSLFTIVQGKIDKINNIVQENLIGIRVVKSFVTQKHEINKFQAANDDLTNASVRAGNLIVLAFPLMMLVMNGAIIVILWMGGQMVSAGSLGPGELISFISYVFHILFSVMMLSMIIMMSARAKASGIRVVEVLETEVDIVDKLPEEAGQTNHLTVRSGSVEFRNVSFRYNGEATGENVLCGITFTAESGQVIGVVGGTGSGKSSLVHLIPRLYDITEGAVLVDGVDVRDYPLEVLREEIGVVLQKNTLFSGTILENLRWGKKDPTEEEILSACRNAQAHEFIQDFPAGYDTRIEQGGVNLSGGQKQRLCIARAMIKKPKILILDDSTSAVDSSTEAKIREAFDQSLKGTTVFIIAQRLSSVHQADQILVLDDGQIVGAGKHSELLETNPVYQQIHASQQEGMVDHG